jgi:SAM-dependent methyltransferase
MQVTPPSYGFRSRERSPRGWLRLQSLMWEDAGKALLASIDPPSGSVALDVGCGAMSWLSLLSSWVGDNGRVVGTDVDVSLLDEAEEFVDVAGLRNVSLVQDDLFQSRLTPNSFDILHARFQIAPLGRGPAQMRAYIELLRPGGWLVVEDPDSSSWHFNPPAPAAQRVIDLLKAAFSAGGGDLDAGTSLPQLFVDWGLAPQTRAHVIALPPGHPYLRLPLQYAESLRPRLVQLIDGEELDDLLDAAEAEIADGTRWGTTFTLIQAWGRSPT